ncbi:MAG: nitrate reductase [Thiohalocapsa sp. PB-PSB1]|jgi:hypothetical protein|nr:MAG: hypothetical protein N838_19385 [Thiohalocapsa sp. PB-PSB1]QQO53958.1 MAG: nitrate reductase [Thiohalocapsa sp. PB-PSB1]HCS92267.1 nitrate reductase [Chromatiaceae bacterium]
MRSRKNLQISCIQPRAQRALVRLALSTALTLGLWLPLSFGLAGDAEQAGQDDGISAAESAGCMRCHRMQTLAYRDRDTGKIIDLSILRDAYRHSVHAGLVCGDCHADAYQDYPHRITSANEGIDCVGCHAERGADGAPDLTRFAEEYKHSVHATEVPETFSCFSCHNPHRFRPVADATPVVEVVAANNRLCLDCHSELESAVPRGHDWLPRPRQHWASVRCIDCHTPLAGRDLYAPSHVLLAAAESNRNCVECHRQGSLLLAQLYNHRVAQEREQDGLLSQALYNDAYIIGMSRSPLVDRLGLGLAFLLLVGIVAHGWGRYLAHKRTRESK